MDRAQSFNKSMPADILLIKERGCNWPKAEVPSFKDLKLTDIFFLIETKCGVHLSLSTLVNCGKDIRLT